MSSVAPGTGEPLSRPALEQPDRLVHIAVRRPIGVEGRRLVRDPDVLDQGRDDRVTPALIDEMSKLPGIQHRIDPRLRPAMLSPAGKPAPRARCRRTVQTKALTGDPCLRLDQHRRAGPGAGAAATRRDRARRRLRAAARRQGRQPGAGGTSRRVRRHDGGRGRQRFLRRPRARDAAPRRRRSHAGAAGRAADRLRPDHGRRARREPDRGRLGRQSGGEGGERSPVGARPRDDPRLPDGSAGGRKPGADPPRPRRRRAHRAEPRAGRMRSTPQSSPRSMFSSSTRARPPRSAPNRRFSREGCGRLSS